MGATVMIEEGIPAFGLSHLAHRENNYNSCRTDFLLERPKLFHERSALVCTAADCRHAGVPGAAAALNGARAAGGAYSRR